MDNNDSNTKPQQTGGLKLMTVFIAVLALHVVVIGGFTVYHLMSGGGTDADVVSMDKSKKDMKPADGMAMASTTTPDAAQPDKATPATPATPSTTPTTDVATAAVTPTVPDVTGPNEIVPPTPGPAPLLKPSLVTKPLPTTTTPLTLTPSDSGTSEKLAALAPLTSDLASESAPAPAATPTSATPSGPISAQTPAPTSAMASGPVHMPPAAKAPSPTHVDGPTYTVKITDSYKKIATAHHITVAQLKLANHIKDDTLHTGQKLIIPSAKTLVAGTAPASSLDAKPMTSSLSTTSTATLAAAPVAKTTAGSHQHLYTVVKGDTLVKIAHKFKTTKAAIMAENNLTDATKLSIGKKLKIPSKESRSAGNNVPAAVPTVPQVQPPVQPVLQPQPQVEAKSTDVSAQLANFQGSTDF